MDQATAAQARHEASGKVLRAVTIKGQQTMPLHLACGMSLEAVTFFIEHSTILERLRNQGVSHLEDGDLSIDINAFLDNLALSRVPAPR